jgi:prolyl-tRNA synthetase
MPLRQVREAVSSQLAEDQQALYDAALAFREARTVEAASIDEATEGARTGWATIPWSVLGEEGESKLADSGITVRCLTMPDGSVPPSEDAEGVLAVVGRAY